MKRSYLLADDGWATRWLGLGDRAAVPAPGTAADTLYVDEGDPYALAAEAATPVSVGAGSAKPVASIAQLADYLINGFWQYTGSIAHYWASNTITYNINGLNSAEQFLTLSALQAWSQVANINFVQTSGSANLTFTHNGTMQAYTSASWYGSGAIASATVNISSDWVTTDGGANDGKTGIDSYAYQTYIHEIGHALGLGHQGPYNGSASYSTNAVYANDTWQYSIMSYFAEDNYSGSSYRYVVTPQIADIYAVASIYGAATSTRTGGTVYGFHSNAGAVFDFSSYSQAPALTIYDSGGNDTLDCSGYSAAQTIDLHPGAFSSVGGLVHNIGIALNTTVENAIGGSGNDTLIANDSGCTLTGGAGDDWLFAGAGVDVLTGGGGADTFVFAVGDSPAATGQHDKITDFTSGVDHIDLSAIDAISATAVHDAFHFIGLSGFDGVAGELDYSYNGALGVTVLQGDTNGDKVADFAIDLAGNVNLNADDVTTSIWDPRQNFDGINRDDILWQNDSGQAAIWLMNGTTILGGGTAGPNPGASWHINASGDFNGDGKSDILWQNDSGQAAIWLMNGTTILGGGTAGPNPGASWHIKASGDFNGDGKSDILWQNDGGQAAIWLMNGTTILGGTTALPNPGASWHIKASGDFNGDGKSDILWQNDGGQAAIWLMNGTAQIGGATVGANPGVGWHVKDSGDFNGDGKSDILWQNDSGQAAIWLMNGTTPISGATIGPNPGASWHLQGAAEVNNSDNKSDFLWQNDSGQAAVWLIDGLNLVSGVLVGPNPGSDWHLV